MFKKATNLCVIMVQKFLPDPFIFAVLLTFLCFILAMLLTSQGPLAMAIHWGNGFWSLLSFTMQMAVVLCTGNALATAPPVKKFLEKLASAVKSPVVAIVACVLVELVACLINWGFGLVVGAIFAKEVAKKVRGLDYRHLVAATYCGYVVWHGGLSGSIPLALATGGDALKTASGGVLTSVVPISETIFSAYNITIILAIAITLPILLVFMAPKKQDIVEIDPKLLEEAEEEVKISNNTPAEKLENSMIISLIIGILGYVILINHFAKNGFKLDLNIVNSLFLFTGILLHKTPIRYVKAINEAARNAGPIILQFPFYAGIMGMMQGANAAGVSLAGVVSNAFVSISTVKTFPMFSFLSAGIVNLFVPSGGGQWAVQGPVMLPAAQTLGVAPSVAAMSIAWGDCWTNLIQPFWALPLLGIAGLKAKDIMGYCLMATIWTGIIICGGLLLLA